MDPNDFSRNQSLMGPSGSRGRARGRVRGRGRGRGRGYLAPQDNAQQASQSTSRQVRYQHHQSAPPANPRSNQPQITNLTVRHRQHSGYRGPVPTATNGPVMDHNQTPTPRIATIERHHQRPLQQLSYGQNIPTYIPRQPSKPEHASKVSGHQPTSQSFPLLYVYAHTDQLNSAIMPASATDLDKHSSTILSTPFGTAYTLALANLVIPLDRLGEFGYRFKDFTARELLDKRRCEKCNKPWSKVRKGQEHVLKSIAAANLQRQKSSTDTSNQTNATKDKPKHPDWLCRFHPGEMIRQSKQSSEQPVVETAPNSGVTRLWSCCNAPRGAMECDGHKLHTFVDVDIKILVDRWQYQPTPPIQPLFGTSYRLAVALDCEMGFSKAGESELIRVTLIDYYTSEVLIDKLVYPNVPMQHLNTRYSGVTWPMMNAALAKKECFRGRMAALQEIWRFVSPETIVVAHSGNNDLNSLHWRHNKVVDTYLLEWVPEHRRQKKLQALAKQQEILEKESGETVTKPPAPTMTKQETDQSIKPEPTNADTTKGDKQEPKSKGEGGGQFSLKFLTKKCLERDVQVGTKGHDSLEDAIAARDLAHWHVRRRLEGRIEASDSVWDDTEKW